jgi:hypothetical protein
LLRLFLSRDAVRGKPKQMKILRKSEPLGAKMSAVHCIAKSSDRTEGPSFHHQDTITTGVVVAKLHPARR